MRQTFKTPPSLRLMIPVLVAAALFAGCNNTDTKTSTSTTTVDSSSSKMDSGSAKMTTAVDTSKLKKDTLPPIDTTVTHRPEDRVIKKP